MLSCSGWIWLIHLIRRVNYKKVENKIKCEISLTQGRGTEQHILSDNESCGLRSAELEGRAFGWHCGKSTFSRREIQTDLETRHFLQECDQSRAEKQRTDRRTTDYNQLDWACLACHEVKHSVRLSVCLTNPHFRLSYFQWENLSNLTN